MTAKLVARLLPNREERDSLESRTRPFDLVPTIFNFSIFLPLYYTDIIIAYNETKKFLEMCTSYWNWNWNTSVSTRECQAYKLFEGEKNVVEFRRYAG